MKSPRICRTPAGRDRRDEGFARFKMNTNPVNDVDPKLEQLRQLVAGARAQLAELQTDYTREKSRAEAVQAVLFLRLREHSQKRDRLRLAVEYRQKFLDSFVRDSIEEAEQSGRDLEQAKARLDGDYDELSAAAEKKKQLTAGQEAELTPLWEKLVKLHQPGRFAREPDKWETYQRLTAIINHAKDDGDIEILREIAGDPHGYMLQKGWGKLDFSDAEELAQLNRLHETLQKEIAAVAESLQALRASPDYELCRLVQQKPGVLDGLAAERVTQLEGEITGLELQAEQLAGEIKKLGGEPARQSKLSQTADCF